MSRRSPRPAHDTGPAGRPGRRSKPRLPRRALTDDELRAFGRNWNSVNSVLTQLTEADLRRLLELERNGNRRLHIAMRIQTRISRLAAARERQALLANF